MPPGSEASVTGSYVTRELIARRFSESERAPRPALLSGISGVFSPFQIIFAEYTITRLFHAISIIAAQCASLARATDGGGQISASRGTAHAALAYRPLIYATFIIACSPSRVTATPYARDGAERLHAADMPLRHFELLSLPRYRSRRLLGHLGPLHAFASALLLWPIAEALRCAFMRARAMRAQHARTEHGRFFD